MKIVVLDRGTLGDDIDLSPIEKLGDTDIYELTQPTEVAFRIKDAQVVIVNKIKLNKENLSFAKNLKLICVAATGYDNIDISYCEENKIALCNVPGYSTDSVAQLSVTMALSLVTHLTEYRNFVHSGEYSKSDTANKLTPIYHEVSSMKWGVVGGGGIGTRVAEIASALGCDVSVCRRKNEGNFKLENIDTICETCDIISLHIPLTEETKHLINKERISKMKKDAVIINTARGAVTDEKALADAIKEERIGGIGVDVYSKEPFDELHPFYSVRNFENVCLTPHMAWGSSEARERCVKKIAENIYMFFKGNPQNRIV